MFSFGGNKSDSKANMNQEVFGPQGTAMSNMYNHFQDIYGQAMPYMNLGMGASNQAMPYMQAAADMGRFGGNRLSMGGAYGDVSGVRDNLYSSLSDSMNNPSSMGRMYEDIIGGPGNTYVDPLIDASRQATEERRLGMQSGNALNASAMGQGGSNRHAMENAMTNRMVNQDQTLFENSIGERNYDRDMGWKMDIARQADLGRGQAQDRAMNVLGGQDQNVMNAMNYQPTMQNLGMGQMAPYMQAAMMPYMMMNMYSQAMGDPTVLSSGSQKGSGGGLGFGVGGGGIMS
jgi:hypothetical protein